MRQRNQKKWKWKESECLNNADYYFPDETEEPKEDAEGGQALLKKEDPVAGTVGEIFVFYKSHRWAKEKEKGTTHFHKSKLGCFEKDVLIVLFQLKSNQPRWQAPRIRFNA